MSLVLLTETTEFTFPEETGAQVVWVIVLIGLLIMYFFVSRSRRRAREHYLEMRRREDELQANDPDMKKD